MLIAMLISKRVCRNAKKENIGYLIIPLSPDLFDLLLEPLDGRWGFFFLVLQPLNIGQRTGPNAEG